MKKGLFVTIVSILLVSILFVLKYYNDINKIDINIKEISIFQNEYYELKFDSKVQYTFSSNDINIATVDNIGRIYGINPGKTEVIVKSRTEEYNIDVYINPKYTIDLELNREYDLEINNYEKFNITNDIISFKENKIKGLQLGNSSIIFEINKNDKIKYSFNILKVKLLDFNLNIKDNYSMFVGNELEIDINEIIPEDSVIENKEFISSNPEILKYENNKLYALKEGNVILTVTCNEIKKDYNIIVKNKINATKINIKSNDIKLIKDNYYVLIGKENTNYNLDINLEPFDVTDKDIIFTSSDSSIVNIKDNTINTLKSGNSDIEIKTISNPNLSIKLKVLVIPNSVYEAKTYSKITYLKKFNSSSELTWKYDLSEDSTYSCAQSMILSDKYIIVNQINGPNTKGRLNIIDRNTFKTLFKKNVTKIGHANGATYNFRTNEYIIASSVSKDTIKLTGIYPFNVDIEKKDITLIDSPLFKGKYVSRMAYDRNLDIYALGDQNNAYVYDTEGNKIRDDFKIKRTANQDVAMYNGVMYRAHSSGNIDLYRITDGAYLGSYYFDFDEIEDIEIYDSSNVLLLFYRSGTNKDKLYMTKKIKIFN